MEDICAAASGASPSTFNRYYRVNVAAITHWVWFLAQIPLLEPCEVVPVGFLVTLLI